MVCIEADEELRAALQVQTELDLAGRLALNAIDDRVVWILVGLYVEVREVRLKIVGADGFAQQFKFVLLRIVVFGDSGFGGLDDIVKPGVFILSFVREDLYQRSIRRRVHFPDRPRNEEYD